jgi:hypothetical protein
MNVMKKIVLFATLMMSLTVIYGQKSIDNLFEKYAGKAGYVSVTISGDLLKFATSFNDNQDDCSIPAKVTEIRILAQEDDDEINSDNLKADNFYDLVIKGIKVGDYEEFMSVKKSDQDMKMYVRAEGNKFREFLLIAGGEDNAIIQIKGEMTFKEAKKFSEEAKKNHGLNIVAAHK